MSDWFDKAATADKVAGWVNTGANVIQKIASAKEAYPVVKGLMSEAVTLAKNSETIMQGVQEIKTGASWSKAAFGAIAESPASKFIGKASGVISLAEGGVHFARGAYEVYQGHTEQGTQEILRGSYGLLKAAGGPVAAGAEYVIDKGLDKLYDHELGKGDHKDGHLEEVITKSANHFLKVGGEGIADGITWTVENAPKGVRAAENFIKKEAGEAKDFASKKIDAVEQKAHDVKDRVVDGAKAIVNDGKQVANNVAHKVSDTLQGVEHKAASVAHDVKDKAVEVAHKASDTLQGVEHKAVNVAHDVKDKAVEVANKVENKVADVADKVENKVADVANKVENKVADVVNRAVPPEVQDQAKADFKQAIAQPGVVNKLEGLSHAGHNLMKGLGIGH